ncbi:MAG: HDOD domain-containing protein [Azonexus sp.]|nr:HDOD domain-containing protein [Betaproteobacteria bacterium]MBP6036162.1 HDOD domain-containing protein [Azonexus sp.]MBP6906685.1 HDOD domain-containing protein [Azonexus sp.]
MSKIGRFELRRELGRGAQSVVYLGFDPQLQREVAIKTLHLSGAAPGQAAALLQEARTVGRLRHPNLVPIFEAGEQGGDPYLVFEYVPGTTLAAFLKASGALPPARAVGLLRPVLDALEHAHRQGIVHRDLKPANILLDEDSTPRVMDFGIAARLAGNGEGEDQYSGTPAYMAPEYIAEHKVTLRGDVFAAGLILYELLTGERAAGAGETPAVLRRIVDTDLRLPQGGVDGRLAALVHKALSRDAELRYQSAAQFGEALDAYLDPGEEVAPRGEGRQATLDFLLRRMRHKSDFPALSESVSAINKIANSERESISKLSNSILKDFALTNKLLRFVNSAYFRPAGGGNISTVSRAVIVLGFEAVRNIAVTVLLFEHLQNKGNANLLKEEFLRANLAGILARDLGTAAQMKDLEQTFICALFHNLGRLLSQYYFPDESDEIRLLAGQGELSEEQAALRVLGIGFEDLGLAIARQWGFPPLIVNSMRKLPAGPVKKPADQEGRLQVLSGMANELCAVIAQAGPEARERELKKALGRFGPAVGLEKKEVEEAMGRSIEQVGEFARIVHLGVQQTAFGRQMRQFLDRGGEAPAADDTAADDTILGERGLYSAEAAANGGDAPAGEDAQAILAAGIQDISNTLVDGYKLNDILRIILETMYRAMGFKRVILCIKDARAGTMQGRFGFGPDANEVAKAFRFSLSFTPDIFHAATSKGVDLLISDIDDPKIAPRIPAWYRKAIPARSFVLFPLNIKGAPVALIYADQDRAGQIVLPDRELSLLRTLRNQAVLAIKQGG